MEIEKLYSPLSFYLHNRHEEQQSGEYGMYDHFDSRYAIPNETAAEYADAVELFVRSELDDLGSDHGLMAYYSPGSAVADKVFSLFPAVELHGGRLWMVAVLRLNEPLTPEEIAELKDRWTTQLSLGWGKSLKQREITVDSGELYMESMTSDDAFFIDTEREFMRRIGLELQERVAHREQKSSGNPVAISLRLDLVERLCENLSEYFDKLRGLDREEIADMSSEIAVWMEAHHYLTEQHGFEISELEYLLQFQNPLSVVADVFGVAGVADRSDVMWEIFDRQAALHGDYPLMPGVPDTPDEIIERIAKKHCRFETLETRKRDSLDFREVSIWGMKAALEEAFAAGQTHQRTHSIDAVKRDIPRRGRDASAKPSVLAQLRDAAKEPKEPRRDKPARDKSRPEH